MSNIIHITKYNRTNKHSFEGEILIEIRKHHILEITKEFIKNNIVPKEYLDNLIKINTLKNGNTISPEIYTTEKRTQILEHILQRECGKGTAKLINELTNPRNI